MFPPISIDKQMKTLKFTARRSTQSDFQLMVDALNLVSNELVFACIVSIIPEYVELGLILFVTYISHE